MAASGADTCFRREEGEVAPQSPGMDVLLRDPTIIFALKGLVTNYREGGLQNGRGGSEVLPLRKGGAEKV